MEKRKRKIYRSSITGEIVTKEFALANPETTQSETIWIAPKPKAVFEPSDETETESKNILEK